MMRVKDVMTVAVITAERTTPVITMAKTMINHGIGSIPIVEGGVLVGLVTRADVLPFEDDPDRSLRTAEDVMSRDLLTVHEEMSVPQTARALAGRGVKRAPVVRDRRLVGIVSESDLLRPYLRTDREIQADVEEALTAPALGLPRGAITAEVVRGEVHLFGVVHGGAQRALVGRMVRAVEGVAAVIDETRLEAAPLPTGS